MKIRDIFIALFIAIVWAANNIGAKYALNHFPICYWVSMRMIICAIALLPFYKKVRMPLSHLILLGTNYSLLTILRYKGIEMKMDVSVVIIIDKLSNIFSVILGVMVLKEKINNKTKIGILLTIAGTMLLSSSPKVSGNWLAFASVLTGAFCWAIYNIQIKTIKETNYMAVMAWSTLFGVILPTILSLYTENSHIQLAKTATMTSISGVIFTAIFPLLLGNGLWYYLLSKYPLSQITAFVLLEPVLGFIGAIVILNETVTLKILGGLLIIFTGVLFIVYGKEKTTVLRVVHTTKKHKITIGTKYPNITKTGLDQSSNNKNIAIQ
ncbi:O-acetylserine/cysteine efflux transporter [Candidatus Xenohaliotis californiensis]|uniref:S-adenosylmethionine uptake transporter n=1 Tax=Candidatus Xenohaliotis californiensis TaxID=84677 RepID=A0ABP0EVR0_9RICK|nr:O-acetylserine/cysteine efflux transporter [Candidatus Xenohaliotis californiensis]